MISREYIKRLKRNAAKNIEYLQEFNEFINKINQIVSGINEMLLDEVYHNNLVVIDHSLITDKSTPPFVSIKWGSVPYTANLTSRVLSIQVSGTLHFAMSIKDDVVVFYYPIKSDHSYPNDEYLILGRYNNIKEINEFEIEDLFNRFNRLNTLYLLDGRPSLLDKCEYFKSKILHFIYTLSERDVIKFVKSIIEKYLEISK